MSLISRLFVERPAPSLPRSRRCFCSSNVGAVTDLLGSIAASTRRTCWLQDADLTLHIVSIDIISRNGDLVHRRLLKARLRLPIGGTCCRSIHPSQVLLVWCLAGCVVQPNRVKPSLHRSEDNKGGIRSNALVASDVLCRGSVVVACASEV